MENDAPLFQAAQLLGLLQDYWWPFCRLIALLGTAPLFAQRALPVRARVLIALVLALALARSLPPMPQIEPLSLRGVLTTLEQLAIGALFGLALQLVFVIFSLVGEVISSQMGMSLARYNDPLNGVSSSLIVGQVYFILLVFLFLAIDGHLLCVSVIYQSFIYWPVGSGLHYEGFSTLIYALGWVIAAATLLSLPMVFCTLLVQFCFGLLNRISPAMNLFSLGFPLSIVTGLLCIWATLSNIPQSHLHLTRELLDNLGYLLRSSP